MDVFCERARVRPVPKAECIVLGVSSAHRDERKTKNDNDEQEFATGQPELGFAIGLDSKDVDGTIEMVSLSSFMPIIPLSWPSKGALVVSRYIP